MVVGVDWNISNLLSNMGADGFSEALSQIRKMVEQYCQRYHFPTAHIELAGATVEV